MRVTETPKMERSVREYSMEAETCSGVGLGAGVGAGVRVEAGVGVRIRAGVKVRVGSGVGAAVRARVRASGRRPRWREAARAP